jgi:beta-glucosidase
VRAQEDVVEGKVFNYNQVDRAVEARADALLATMTLEEKVGQLAHATLDTPDMEAHVRAGRVGVFVTDDVRVVNRLQRMAVEESRLHIPLLMGLDVIHGFRTIFPIPLAESCTWDPDLLERATRVAAEEASAHGIDQFFAPMVDITRDPRWGRVAEGAGEDPCLGAAIARARVHGIQARGLESGRRVTACPKHFIAYGAAEGGRDYNTVDISERTLRDVYLPPFAAAFAAGAGSVMASFNEVAGIPSVANRFVLRTVLRQELGFQGLVYSDYESVENLVNHGLASDLREAAALAVQAGIEMSSNRESGAYRGYLAELVRDGTIDEALVDAAARHMLRLKVALGLFERPYADEQLAQSIILRDEHRALGATQERGEPPAALGPGEGGAHWATSG